MREVDVVIINWRDAERTKRCVESLWNQHGISRIVIVDNESTGELQNSFNVYPLPVIVLPVTENRGFAGGVNVALDYLESVNSAADVLFLNNDAEMIEDSLFRLRNALAIDATIGIATPVILNSDESMQAMGSRISKMTGFVRSNTRLSRIDFATWACVLIRAETLRTVGHLDERFFMYWEDVDFAIRAKANNIKTQLVMDAKVKHELSASKDKSGERLRTYNIWSARELGNKYKGVWYWRMRLMFTITLLKQLALINLSGVRAIWLGWTHVSSEHAYKVNK